MAGSHIGTGNRTPAQAATSLGKASRERVARMMLPFGGMRASVLAVLAALLCACTMNHELDGLTPQEQALLGCWTGVWGTIGVKYRFNTDRVIESIQENGSLVQGTFTAGTNMMEL